MIEQMFGRTKLPQPSDKIEVYTDGNDDYKYVLAEYYASTCMDYGQVIKIRENNRLVGREKRTIYGNPDADSIETTDVENFNGILRERIGRLVRKTKCFSKYRRRLECALDVFQFYWNFMNEFKRSTSPAMLEGLSEHLWTWSDFLWYSFAV